MSRSRLVSALKARVQFVRETAPTNVVDRLDADLAELVALVADLRSGRAVATALEETHANVLSTLGFDFLMHTVGCRCDLCSAQIGRVVRMPTLPPSEDAVSERTRKRGAELLAKIPPVAELGAKGGRR